MTKKYVMCDGVCINDDAKSEERKSEEGGGERECGRGGKEGAKRHIKGHSAPNPVSSSVVSQVKLLNFYSKHKQGSSES